MEASKEYEEKKITTQQFMNRLTFKGNNICCGMVPDRFDNIEDDEVSDDGAAPLEALTAPANEISCIICWDATPGVILYPCRHIKVCMECFRGTQAMATVDGETLRCSMCRTNVDSWEVAYV